MAASCRAAIAFKTEKKFDPLTQCPILVHEPVDDRVAFVAEQAKAWVRLRASSTDERRVALIFANYPNRDGRLGNGVGLDTPASAVGNPQASSIERIRDRSRAGNVPRPDADAILGNRTNALEHRSSRDGGVAYQLSGLRNVLEGLPQTVRDAVTARWGPPQSDPSSKRGRCGRLPSVGDDVRLGRGRRAARAWIQHRSRRDLSRSGTRSAAQLPAFYAWLRRGFDAHAVVHLGKHGNLEWLPGKALALSHDCFPEVTLGALPHIYPFIVNDPGEGSQAKRRASAVIVDHLTPPLTRAESYGPLKGP